MEAKNTHAQAKQTTQSRLTQHGGHQTAAFPLAVYSLKCLVSSFFFLCRCPAAKRGGGRRVTRRGGGGREGREGRELSAKPTVEPRGEARLEAKTREGGEGAKVGKERKNILGCCAMNRSLTWKSEKIEGRKTEDEREKGRDREAWGGGPIVAEL